MSIKNEDRHGLANLSHERVKALDKMHFPPWLIFLLVAFPVCGLYFSRIQQEEEELYQLRDRNVLLAMRKTQQRQERGETEADREEEQATEMTRQTVQYKEVVERKRKSEERKLRSLKEVYLAGGAGERAKEKVDITSIINQDKQ